MGTSQLHGNVSRYQVDHLGGGSTLFYHHGRALDNLDIPSQDVIISSPSHAESQYFHPNSLFLLECNLTIDLYFRNLQHNLRIHNHQRIMVGLEMVLVKKNQKNHQYIPLVRTKNQLDLAFREPFNLFHISSYHNLTINDIHAQIPFFHIPHPKLKSSKMNQTSILSTPAPPK